MTSLLTAMFDREQKSKRNNQIIADLSLKLIRSREFNRYVHSITGIVFYGGAGF